MWSTVLVLTLLLMFDPVRLGLALLLISRPRPLQNLVAYWMGAVTVSLPYVLVPLTLLHVIPAFRSFAQKLATPATFTSPTVRHIQLGIGVLVLSIVALMAVRFRVRQRLQQRTPVGVAPALVPDSNTSVAIPPPRGGAHDVPAGGGPPIRRLRGRARDAWENGSLWVAVAIGLGSGPPPLTILLVITSIMASNARVGVQVVLAIGWVVVMFAVVEIILASHLVMPAKTQAALRLLHDWTRAHWQKILVAMGTVVGVALIARGIGGT